MSTKTPSQVKKDEARPALVPKLRFPEFRGAEEWEEKSLENAAEINPASSDLPESFIYIDIESVNASELKAKNCIKRIGAPSRAQRLVEHGDIIYQVVRPYQRNNLLCEFDGDEDYVASTGYAQLRAKGNNHFLYQSIHTDSFVERVMAKCTGSNYPAINSSDLAKIVLALPPSIAEQQKIAECLSSLDELMAAQARKVDALKTHKKGLMQQLFPREGETQPRLRFPEFQDAGEWVAKPLGEIFPITSSKRVHESDWTAAGVPFYRAREIVALNKHEPIQPLFISEELYAEFSRLTGEIREGHLLVTGVGSIGVPYLVKAGDRFYFKDGNIIWLKNDGKELTGDFLLRLYETECVQKQLKKMADVGTVATYTIDNAKRTLAAFPPKKAEQQRIAGCLSALDAQITAETQKLESLKTHKKGLMQKLFPSPEDPT